MHIRPYEIVSYGAGLASVRVTGSCHAFEWYGVPVGFVCDGASVPRWLWWLCGDPFEEPRIIAAIVHDWLYECKIIDRRSCDRIYRYLLVGLGMPGWQRQNMCLSVCSDGCIGFTTDRSHMVG